jgi:hypothetical protein
LDPNYFESVNFIRDKDSTIRPLKGQVFIKTKANYFIKPITLRELKEKYATSKDRPAIFTLDGEIIDYDYDNYQLDENKLLTVRVEVFENTKEKLNFILIKLFTRSQKNLQDRHKVIIRGADSQL